MRAATAPDRVVEDARAADLRRNDRIPPGFLPSRQAATVQAVYLEQHAGEPYAFVVYVTDDGRFDGDHFQADGQIPVDRTPQPVPAHVVGFSVSGRHDRVAAGSR